MANRTRQIQYEPISVLCIYKGTHDRYYIEQNNIVPEGGFYTGFKPINEDFVKTVFKNLDMNKEIVNFGGYVPPQVVGFFDKLTHKVVMWRSAEGPQELLFSKSSGAQSGKYYVPGLIWTFGTTLSIMAYKEWKGEDTELYCAPFMNTTDTGVCMGSASSYIGNKNKFTFVDLIKTVETAFWKSQFTHGGGHQVNGNLMDMLNKTRDAKEFPYEYLKPLRSFATLKDYLQKQG